MTHIVPAQQTRFPVNLAVSLARYAQLVGIPECAIWGVSYSGDQVGECRGIWIKPERDQMIRALAEAQQLIEHQVGYPLVPRWIGGSDNPDELDEQRFRPILTTVWSLLLYPGQRAMSMISAAAVVNHAADPAVIGPIATTVTDPDEIHIFHPGSAIEINPSGITISGGNVTIQIPRCRMVKLALIDNPRSGLDYNDLTNFTATVDVRRVYNDPSKAAEWVWPHGCSDECAAGGCVEYVRDACMTIRRHRIGVVETFPANYTGGQWVISHDCGCNGCPSVIRLHYRAGMQTVEPGLEEAVVRLAHARVPTEPCGCDNVLMLWRRDRNVPPVAMMGMAGAAARQANPFGLSDGEWYAWKTIQSYAVRRGSVLI